MANIITYRAEESAEIDDGWIVVGHYEKIKSLYEGKEFVFTGNIYTDRYGSQSFESVERGKRDERLLEAGSRWRCKEVSVNPTIDYMAGGKNNSIMMIMENKELGDYYCCYSNNYATFCGGDKKSMFMLVADYEKMKSEEAIKKEKRKAKLIEYYGKVNTEYILRNEVRIGMTASMCHEALGSPNKKNRTSGSYGTREQWVYEKGDYKYLYFEDGKLTAIQD